MAKRGPGRPAGTGPGYVVPLGTVRLTEVEAARLERIIQQSGLKKAEIARRALTAWMDAWESGSDGEQ